MRWSIGPTVGITSTPGPSTRPRAKCSWSTNEFTGGDGASHHLDGLISSAGPFNWIRPSTPPPRRPSTSWRPGLALDAGKVIVGFGGNAGDCGTYPTDGWRPQPEGGPIQTFEVAKPSPDSKGAIWMGGARPGRGRLRRHMGDHRQQHRHIWIV